MNRLELSCLGIEKGGERTSSSGEKHGKHLSVAVCSGDPGVGLFGFAWELVKKTYSRP